MYWRGISKEIIAHFVSKLSDADMENGEIQVWLLFALPCNYIAEEIHNKLLEQSREVGRLLAFMMKNPEKFNI